MSLNSIGFDVNEAADPAVLNVFLGTHFETDKDKSPWAQTARPIGYAAIVVGADLLETVWGFGYATFEDAGRAAAVRHAAEFRKVGQTMICHGRGLVSHVGKQGTVHAAIPSGLTTHGDPYDAYDDLAATAVDILKRIIEWVPAPKRNGPVEFQEALRVAADDPWRRALQYQPHFGAFFEIDSRNHIIGRNDNPDPLNIIK